MKLRCDLKAAYAKRIRFSSNTGDPHFKVSFAFGATFFRMARSSSNFFCASLGAAFMYSGTVVGLVFAMLFPFFKPFAPSKLGLGGDLKRERSRLDFS